MSRACFLAALAISAMFALGGCGEDTASDPHPEAQQEQDAAQKELRRARRELAKERQRLRRERRQATRDAPEPVPASPGKPVASESGDATVPDVVGNDHQLAQDTMQAAGFYALQEEDATGQGRSLFYDRNWTVVEQSPPGGTKASPDQTIVLRSKKDDE